MTSKDRAVRATTPIVAIGASAGGLEAIKEFLSAAPNDSGACFVYVQHLDPSHKSMLVELLARCTDMKVLQAEDKVVPEPDTVVLIPPDTTLTYADGELKIERPAPPRRHRTPIDTFFESVASELAEDAICVLLSGTGSDGTHGLGLVKEGGGLTIAQKPGSAKYDGMPQSAIATGFVDHVLPPEEMPQIIIEHLQRVADLKANGGVESLREKMSSNLAKICNVLGARTGHEFREYKEATLLRRIHRRMQVLRIDDAAHYLEHLQQDSMEVGKLLRELLISVTGFFRDPDAFEELDRLAISSLVENAKEGTVRVWVPGCATGEEAYTLAMLIHARFETAGHRAKIQLFATDIDERALEIARRGCYSEALVNHVPEEYRKRYFRREGTDYRIVEELRELCIFSVQNVIKDPPFSRMDLISCRNLLIYLTSPLQDRLLPVFHYSLRENGVLFLGTSENVTRQSDLFKTISPKWRIFRREQGETPVGQRFAHYSRADAPSDTNPPKRGKSASSQTPTALEAAEQLILNHVGPPFAIVAEDRSILYTMGAIDRYLSFPRGAPSLDIINAVKPDLKMDVRSVLHRAMSGEDAIVNAQLLMVEQDKRRRRLRIECRPVGSVQGKHSYLIAFHDCGDVDTIIDETESGAGRTDIEALEKELAATKEYLHTTTEELESSNEELKSANEELMSMNEELQSSNEELETSKEELQSVNEELETVNAELSAKVEELAQSNGDLQNLFESIDIATIFLDQNLLVRKFTPRAKELFHLIEADVGRTITDITTKITGDSPLTMVGKVIENHQGATEEVGIVGANRRFMMRILPYRKPHGSFDGAVMTFIDITDLSNAESTARRRAKQQHFVARLGQSILEGVSRETFLPELPGHVAQLLDADFAKILKFRPESSDFELVAATGFPEIIGTIVPGGEESQAGYTLGAGEPVIVENLTREKRFSGPEILTANEVRSGISAVIPGPDGQWGAIGVHSKHVRSFTREDTNFILAIAHLVSASLKQEAILRDLHESQNRLSEALKAGNLGVHDFDPQTGEITFDERACELWGIPSGTRFSYDQFVSSLHPEDRARVETTVQQALDADGAGHYLAEYRVLDGVSGRPRWVRADGNVTFESGKPVRLVGTVADISEERRAQEQEKLLMREVNHRSKNLLAIVQAIARQTAKDQKQDVFVQIFGERLAGLAHAQDLIIEGNWSSVDMEDLVQSQITHLGSEFLDRISLHGDEMRLSPAAAQGIALAIHELATNAIKYGSLSNDAGSVTMDWRIKDDEVIIEWFEVDGPKVKPPEKKGFGSNVIERLVASSVNGTVKVDFKPTGLEWKLSAAAKAVLASEEHE